VTNDKDFDKEVDRMIDAMILKGLIEVSSIDAETGEFLYRVSDEIIEAMPGIREDTANMFLETLDDLWIKGFISMDKTLDNPIVSLNEKSFDEEEVSKLSFQERVTLYTVMDALKIKDEE
jgi:hypothetical protein